MPIAASDVLKKYSVSTASAGNTTAGSVTTSLGGFISTTVVPDGASNNVFPAMTGAENAALNVDYVCLFIHNNHPTLTMQNARVWVPGEVSGGAAVAIAVDPTSASAIGSGTQQAVAIATKNTAPAGVSPFTLPTTAAAALPLGDIGPGQCKAVWIRRTATNSAGMADDGLTIQVDSDTTA